jgi:hypothetical protein
MQHPASVDAYIRHGWSLVPIPPGTKGPATPGWNQKQNAIQSQHQLPPGYGIGLAHAYSGTMAVDVDEWDRASFELMMHGIDLQALFDAPDAVVVDSGRSGHGKLLYAMPFGLAIPSKKFIDKRTRPDGTTENYNYLDLRCGTANGLTVQDVLPPSIHPQTGQPYRWAGRGHWTRLPVISQPLLDLWMSMLTVEAPQPTAPSSEIDWSEIMSALGAISPDCAREEWVQVGMALHYAGTTANNLDHAFTVWNEWSRPSGKYPGDREMAVQWRSFRTDKTNTVRLGSLFHLARRTGWSKPPVDVSTLFGITDTKNPVQLTSDLRPPPPQLDMSVIPEVLRTRALEIGDGVGCDPMVPLFAGLAAVSGAMDARTRLELKHGFQVPPVLWVMTIGDPADKKTPGSRPMFDVLSKFEAEDRPRYAQAMQQFEALEARHEAAKKAFLDAAKDTELMLAGEIPHGYGDAPPRPAPLKIVVQDITSQKLVRQAADMPRGLLCYLDEMLSWSEKVTDKTSSEARSAWTQAYEAGRYEMDRVGAGTISSDNFAVSIYGNLQPHAFADVAKSMSKDGMIQRFIPVVLRHDMTRKGHPKPASQTNVGQYEQMLRVAFSMPAMTYGLSTGAAKVFDEFQDWYEARKRDERTLHSGPVFMTAFGKLEGMVGRLALVWHVMTDPYSIQVSSATMESVVSFVRGYVIPAMRYAYDSELGGVSGFDQWVADYVIQYADQQTLTMSQIKQSGKRQLKNVSVWGADQMVLSAMGNLEEAGWVVRVDDGSALNKHHAQWAINPALVSMFEKHRREVVEAKQRRMDETYRLSTKGVPKVHGSELLDDSRAA